MIFKINANFSFIVVGKLRNSNKNRILLKSKATHF